MRELEAIRDLAPKWRSNEWKFSPTIQSDDRPTEDICADELEALLPALEKAFADAQALDAHDAAIRERTLQEVFSRCDREGEQDTWNWLCETLDEEASK